MAMAQLRHARLLRDVSRRAANIARHRVHDGVRISTPAVRADHRLPLRHGACHADLDHGRHRTRGRIGRSIPQGRRLADPFQGHGDRSRQDGEILINGADIKSAGDVAPRVGTHASTINELIFVNGGATRRSKPKSMRSYAHCKRSRY